VQRIPTGRGLEWLGAAGDAVAVRRPSWRPDLEREIDLVEEVARIHGYDHIPEDRAVPITSAPRGTRERVEAEVRDLLTGQGFNESVTFSLVEEALAGAVRPGSSAEPLRIDHSSRKLEIALRQSLFPSLMAVRRHNESYGNVDAELFEIAHVYLPRSDKALPDEPTRLALISGRDYRGLKGIVEALLERLHVPSTLTARPVDIPLFASGRSAELLAGDTHLGFLGEVDPVQVETFELRSGCSAAELEFNLLLDRSQLVAIYQPLPSFPAVVRDLSLVVACSLSWADLAAAVVQAAGPNLAAVEYLDTFQGGNLTDDQQSVHFSLTFRNLERTLTGEEVDRAVKAVVDACASEFHASLRSN